MDTLGARHLAARLRAGVRIGTTVSLAVDGGETGLREGDLGRVVDIALDGVVVEWDRGFTLTIDPVAMPYGIVRA